MASLLNSSPRLLRLSRKMISISQWKFEQRSYLELTLEWLSTLLNSQPTLVKKFRPFPSSRDKATHPSTMSFWRLLFASTLAAGTLRRNPMGWMKTIFKAIAALSIYKDGRQVEWTDGWSEKNPHPRIDFDANDVPDLVPTLVLGTQGRDKHESKCTPGSCERRIAHP